MLPKPVGLDLFEFVIDVVDTDETTYDISEAWYDRFDNYEHYFALRIPKSERELKYLQERAPVPLIRRTTRCQLAFAMLSYTERLRYLDDLYSD